MNKGFTLIEVLVVVLIIGILAAIALPQYEVAMEKSRAAEAMVVLKTLVDAEQRYMQAHPNATGACLQSHVADVELKGGAWQAGKALSNGCDSFRTRFFTYDLGEASGKVVAYRIDRTNPRTDDSQTNKQSAIYYFGYDPDRVTESCESNGSDEGETMCRFIEKALFQ
ncbi:MAG: prepilin-type N-terminal cleavage/methylation domain-containing protein [Elusimicrobiaceae bacterium]|nr:prepilin-type N-terminal cleavage/methylation domain-containing protein [Elusimicrobiaceae bacterium]